MKKNTVLNELNVVAQSIYDKVGCNILVLDVQGICTMTDYFVIAEGNVGRHVIAIGKEIVDQLKKIGLSPVHTEGLQDGDWVVLDYSDFVIHLFIPELREKYGIEYLWNDSKIVDVKIDISKSPMSEEKRRYE